MNVKTFKFTKLWTDPAAFPTYEESEAKVREDLQWQPDEIKDFLNYLGGLLKDVGEKTVVDISVDTDEKKLSYVNFDGETVTVDVSGFVNLQELTAALAKISLTLTETRRIAEDGKYIELEKQVFSSPSVADEGLSCSMTSVLLLRLDGFDRFDLDTIRVRTTEVADVRFYKGEYDRTSKQFVVKALIGEVRSDENTLIAEFAGNGEHILDKNSNILICTDGSYIGGADGGGMTMNGAPFIASEVRHYDVTEGFEIPYTDGEVVNPQIPLVDYSGTGLTVQTNDEFAASVREHLAVVDERLEDLAGVAVCVYNGTMLFEEDAENTLRNAFCDDERYCSFEVGETYAVVLDGVRYICEASALGTGDETCLGNKSVFATTGEDTGEPFFIFTDSDNKWLMFCLRKDIGVGEHTFSITSLLTIPNAILAHEERVKYLEKRLHSAFVVHDSEFEAYKQQTREELADLIDSVNALEEDANHLPTVSDESGTWFVWDAESDKYVDSGISAVGPQGPEGPSGSDGKDGLNGADGKDGVTPNIQIGTVTTLEAGNNATVELDPTSTSERPVFNFGIPKGDEGNPGGGGGSGTGSGLPEVTEADAGKILRVNSEGAWALELVADAEDGEF